MGGANTLGASINNNHHNINLIHQHQLKIFVRQLVEYFNENVHNVNFVFTIGNDDILEKKNISYCIFLFESLDMLGL